MRISEHDLLRFHHSHHPRVAVHGVQLFHDAVSFASGIRAPRVRGAARLAFAAGEVSWLGRRDSNPHDALFPKQVA